MTTQNNSERQDIVDFIEDICGDDHLRIECDLGGGFVKLKSSEAEKRQAAQDIRSTEDIVLELLRNSRDANAKHIFIATQRDEALRRLVIIDDGDGIPRNMQKRIFEPRVTSKLDTAHMDKWGMHGRGMALYSVSVNANDSTVVTSEVGFGTSISVTTDTSILSEKADQSTFPKFVDSSGIHSMRGPKNILRIVAEFALEHRKDLTVFCGSFTEIAATIYHFGLSTTSPAQRSFRSGMLDVAFIKRPAFGTDPSDIKHIFEDLGIDISERSARRIMNGEISALPSMVDRVRQESFSHTKSKASKKHSVQRKKEMPIKLDKSDTKLLEEYIDKAYAQLADKYYLERNIPINIKVTKGAISIEIPIERGL